MNGRLIIAFLIAASVVAAVDPQVRSVTGKLDAIEKGQVKPGAVIVFTEAELNAWVRAKAPTVVPQGFRQPHLELGNQTATASALVDFLKVRNAAGMETNWLVAKLIQGEKPVKASAQIQSANGRATVHLVEVEIGGIAVSGSTLDFLIRNFFRPLYPDAKIDAPFELADHVDRIDVTPAGAHVFIRRSSACNDFLAPSSTGRLSTALSARKLLPRWYSLVQLSSIT